MLLALACLLYAALRQNPFLTQLSLALFLLDLFLPKVFTPLAFVWFGLARLLGAVTSKILLTLAFFLIVVPVGRLRRLLNPDPLDLKRFRKGKESVLKEIRHTFQASDLEKPY